MRNVKRRESELCGKCKFYVELRTAGVGDCRVNAPVVYQPDSRGVNSQFPAVYEYWWCGQHQEK